MSKSKADAMVSAAGWMSHLILRITDGLRARGWSNDQIHALVTDEGTETINKIVEAFLTVVEKIGEILPVTVNYDRSVEEGVRAGQYDWTNSDITQENFSWEESDTQKIEMVLVHLDHTIRSEEAIEELQGMGFRPATLPELLAIGEQYPDKQKEFPIVALGSVWRGPYGHRLVPCLGQDGCERGLDLGWFGPDWYPRCRFAAVRT